jgi:putative oxidoreductase
MPSPLTRTTAQKHLVVVRILAGGPLLAFGIMHLAGMAPMKPIVEAAGFPAPGPSAVLASIGEVVAGLMILAGFYTRIGAALAIGVMLGAVAAHIRIPSDAWPQPDGTLGQEPPLIWLAIAIILLSAYLLWRGAGPWSVDWRQQAGGGPARPPQEPA